MDVHHVESSALAPRSRPSEPSGAVPPPSTPSPDKPDVSVPKPPLMASTHPPPTISQLSPAHTRHAANPSRPGSGKSTLAYPLADRVNELLLGHPPRHRAILNESTAVAARPPRASRLPRTRRSSSASSAFSTDDEVAICVGLDGWHHTRAELDRFPDPEMAHWRRGAAFTFDLEAYSAFVSALRKPVDNAEAIGFPTFDHAAKDPAPSDTPILPQHRIVIVEGLYTMLDRPGWRECADKMDLRVWVEVPRDVVRARVLKRNTEAGIVTDDEVAVRRVEESDMVNGDEVFAHRYKVTDTIEPEDRPVTPSSSSDGVISEESESDTDDIATPSPGSPTTPRARTNGAPVFTFTATEEKREDEQRE